jgi:hypothetical protein
VCARVGNQRSRGVVTARVQTNTVQSLHHQHRDLHQSTYPYLSEDRDSSYYHGPFKFLEKRGEVAYQLELPPQLSDVLDVFHVSQLKKCLCVPKEQIPMEDLDAKEDLSYQEYAVKILETSGRVTRNKRVMMCKVQWSYHTEEKPLGKERKS